MIVQQGVLRDSAYYSVIVDEWPAVRSHLEQQLNGSNAAAGAG